MHYLGLLLPLLGRLSHLVLDVVVDGDGDGDEDPENQETSDHASRNGPAHGMIV